MSEMIQQLNLFNFDKEKYVITKPLRLIELFSGIGSQHAACKVLSKICPSFKFESWKTCEWAVPSIKGYNAIHNKDFTDYSKDLTKEQLIEYLDGNVSTDYNQPCNVRKKNEEWLRDVNLSDAQIYHCCGDSIVVSVLMAIFGQMLFSDEELKKKLENYIEIVKE